jgi:hypothetical protein
MVFRLWLTGYAACHCLQHLQPGVQDSRPPYLPSFLHLCCTTIHHSHLPPPPPARPYLLLLQ